MNPACRPLCTMREALDDPAIFGEILPGDTWAPWRAILIASRGEALTADERAIYACLTGREREPERPVDELWGIVGRRGGKSRAFSVLGAYLAGLIDYSAIQAPGERIKLPIMASTTVQAAKIFSYMLGVFQHSAEMQDMVDGEPTADTIRLQSGVDIEVRPANYKTIRGETLAGCLADEVAFWHLENSANPDTLILDAVRPGLATTGGPLCVLSSPYARKGELYRTHQRDFGPNGDPAVLVLRAPSQTMNPSLDPAVVRRAYPVPLWMKSSELRRCRLAARLDESMPKRAGQDPNDAGPVRVEVVPRRGLSRQEASRYIGISTTKFDELTREGQMPQLFRIGSRTIWDLRKLDAAFDLLSGPEEEDSFADWT